MTTFAYDPFPLADDRAHSQIAELVAPPSTYAVLLRAPMSSIASNVSERADVSSVAILGYN
ncbi:hypothetical protein AWB79_06525 [Caballeronia hypogeia]|uniref:Uncharacterized protein n=1 Tax=Caballeronia hypogeia TaxID=1777140 RepID=A0A158D639_9BURK|nr:hypothetical protein [Caballeronia hypogeia]SAK90105.1 hypothetical protein AWB79_06525 [Caballeronia hypogeia]